MTNKTARKHRAEHLQKYSFKSGKSGNPKGRPKGARSKLGEAFLKDMLAAWEERGADAIKVTIAKKPDQFLKVVASILPKEVEVNVNKYDDYSDEQLRRQLVTAMLEANALGLDIGIGERGRADQEGEEKPSGEIPPLQ